MKSCVALAFPPKDQAYYKPGTMFDEQVPPNPVVGTIQFTAAGEEILKNHQRDLVNLDIDPLNSTLAIKTHGNRPRY